ncbi:E3 ubiquitin ligase BIG BROTHER [Morella rubra]|uniref:E3 ubiquitin ligase BIG BROTHER n=1 Tax=Morella rubra TaxID=262757 RepID=A0A6A1WHH3_9ROSI|nr:E3 ubiquitin ligase BIG BROTHER [Morella rubra]
MEVHYINTGFPYTVTESFMNFFEGLTHVPAHYGNAVPMHEQESAYWSMNMNSYKFGMSGPGSTSYYGPYEVNDHLSRMEASRSVWEYPSTMHQEPATTDSQSEGDVVLGVHAIPEECSPTHHNSNGSQVTWQDNVDPDNMTYEELLDLGEAVGSQSRGLSQELISLLPTSKYKFKNLFSTKKSGERCVICQMRYKRGNRQIKLPCKHVYHSECITKWLGINKICPICNTELTSSAEVSESLPLRDQNRRDAKLKRRGLTQSSISSSSNPKFNEDSENQNPNLLTPPILQAKSTKAALKSSTEKKKMTDDLSQNNEAPKLKSTPSVRNLFAGRDIINQISEFCNELKRMATRARERENVEQLNEEKGEVGVVEEKVVKEDICGVLGEVNGREKERRPLPEVGKEKYIGMAESTGKEKQRGKKRTDEAENVPISLDLDSIRHRRDETLLQIRTNPPSPQCFSAPRAPKKSAVSKAAKSRLMERGVLQEVEQNKEVTKEESAEKGRSVSIVDGREAKTLDVFWFLKPCTLSN